MQKKQRQSRAFNFLQHLRADLLYRCWQTAMVAWTSQAVE
jgi:hypothetical protein